MRVRGIEARTIADARKQRTRGILFNVKSDLVDERRLSALKKVLDDFPGRCAVRVVVTIDKTAEVDIDLPGTVRLDPCDEVVERVEQLFGAGAVQFV